MNLLKNPKTSLILIIAGLSIVFIAVLFFFWMDTNITSSEQINSEKWGQFGDFIGGLVGALWALAGVLLFYVALNEQREDFRNNQVALALQTKALNQQIQEFEQQRKELQLNRKVSEQQTKAIRIQQFESHFYSLMNVYLRIKSELNTSIDSDDYFKYLFNDLTCDYEENKETSVHHNKLVESYIKLFNKYRGKLSHFFKCLYRLIKVIDGHPYFTEQEKVHYSKIVRSQLTDFEQLIIQYNSYSPYGFKARPLILKYNLLKHVPLFEKSEFLHYSNIQKGFKLLHFTEFFRYFITDNLIKAFDLENEDSDIVEKEGSFDTLVGIYFSDPIKVEVICKSDITKNEITLTEDQFSEFLYNLLCEVVIFSTYSDKNKVQIKRYTTKTENKKIFGMTIDIENGTNINLNYDRY